MKIKQTNRKPQTISEFCGQEETAFEAFLKRKSEALARMDERTDSKIREALARKMAWAA